MSRAARKPAQHKRGYHHGDLLAAIRATALHFIDRHQSVDFTMRQIAAEIGVTHGALYSHFRNKQALLEDLAVHSLGKLLAHQQHHVGSSGHGLEKLQQLAVAYVEFARSNPGAYRLIFNINDPAGESPRVAMARNSATAMLVAALREAQTQKLIAGGPIDLLAFTLWSAVHGLSHLLLNDHISPFDDAADDIERTIRFALGSYLHGVATAKGRRWLAQAVSG